MYVCEVPFMGDERPLRLGLDTTTCCCNSKFSTLNHIHIWYSFKKGKVAVDSALGNALLVLGTNNPDPTPPKSKYVDREAFDIPLS